MLENSANSLKSVIEAATAVLEGKGKEHQERKFVFDKMQNSDIDVDQLEKQYKKKFGNTKNFDMHVSDFMG